MVLFRLKGGAYLNLNSFGGNFMRIAVIDGQGGGIGKTIIEKVRREFRDNIEIVALGTNSLATQAMIKAGANEGATGEYAIVYTADKVDYIAGSLSLIVANSMLGEMTPTISAAIASSKAKKVLLPIHRNSIDIVGVKEEPLPHQIDRLLGQLKKYMEG